MSQGRKRSNRDSKKLIKSGVSGVVKRYIDTGGYGFITEDDTYNDVFFHISAVSKDNQRLGNPVRDGDRVIYDLYQAPKGYRAESVEILDEDSQGTDSEDTDSEDSGHHIYRRKETERGYTRHLGEGNQGRSGNQRWQRRGRCGAERDQNRRRDGSARRRSEQNIEQDDDDGWRVPRGDRKGEQRWHGGRAQYPRAGSNRRGHVQKIDGNHEDDNDGWGVSTPGDRMQNWRTRNENIPKRNVNDNWRLSSSSSSEQRPRTDSPKRADSNKKNFDDTAWSSNSSSETRRKDADPKTKPATIPRRHTHSTRKEPEINKKSFTNESPSQTDVSSAEGSQETQTTNKKDNIGTSKSDTKSSPQPAKRSYSTKKEPDIRTKPFTDESPSGVSPKGSNQGAQNTANSKESNVAADKSDTKENPQPPPRTAFMKKGSDINKKLFTNKSSSQTGVSSKGSNQKTQNTADSKGSNVGANKSDTASKPQPLPRTDSTKKESDINKESFTNRSSSRTGVYSEERRQGKTNTKESNIGANNSGTKPNPQQEPSGMYSYSYAGGPDSFSVKKESTSVGTNKKAPENLPEATETKESNIGPNKSDTEAKPQPRPRTYSMKKEANIDKESFTNESSSQTGVSSHGSSQGVNNSKESYNGVNKSGTKSSPQKEPSSTYSFSYADGSNRFSLKKESVNLETNKQASGNRESTRSTSGSAKEDITHNRGTLYTEPGKTANSSKVDTGTSNPPSASSLARERGNDKFRLAREQKSESFYKVARGCYKEAYDCSKNDEDMVSAAKNMAMTHWRIATLRIETGTQDIPDHNAIDKFFERALRCFRRAYTKKNCRGQEWANHLEKSIQECLDDIRSWIAPKNEEDRIEALKEFLGFMPNCGAKVNGYLHIATIYFKRAKEALKLDEYEDCKGYLKDCSIPLGEAEKMCSDVDPSIGLGVAALRKDVNYHNGLVDKYVARADELKARRKQQQAEEREKQAAMDSMKVDMENLDGLQRLPIRSFVDYVYILYPPKTGPKLPLSSSSSDTSSEKKMLIRAISQYHPDKVDKKVHGIKWHLLSCEITKCLSMKLAKIK